MADAEPRAASDAKQYAVASYIPAIHRGYLDFFKKYPGTLYILGPEFIKEEPRLERDIRALSPEEIKSLVEGMKLFEKIIVLDNTILPTLANETRPIIMPNDEVNRAFAKNHLPGKAITFVQTFLRWNRQISLTEFEVPPDRIISTDEFNREILAAAAKEAEKTPDWWRQIAAVLVKDGKQIAIARSQPLPSDYVVDTFGDPRSNFNVGEFEYYKLIHSEASLVAEAAKKGISLEGVKLYTTTFPCPTCAKLVATAGIKEVYYSQGYSSLDAEDILRKFGIKIVMVK